MIRFHPTCGARDTVPADVPGRGASRLTCQQACSARGGRGFSLVELMITVAVAAVLMAIAIPSFRSITISNKLTTAANGVVDALNAARMAAVKRNANAQFCSDLASANTSDTLGSACNTSAQPAAVYVLIVKSDGTYTTAPVHAAETDITGRIKLNGNLAALRFWPDGLARVVGTETLFDSSTSSTPVADICSSAISTDNHRIVKVDVGSIITTETTTGACP